MDPKVKTILNILLGALIAISVVIVFVFFFGTTLFDAEAEFSEQISVLGWRLDLFINWAIILSVITAAAAVIFPIAYMITNPQNSKKTLMVVGVMLLVVVVGYVVASDEIMDFTGFEKFFFAEDVEDPNKFSKNVGTILWTTYILGGLTILSILYHEVAKFFK
jgi:hypothetical protein